MQALRSILRIAGSVLLFVAIWFLWPRELDGYVLNRDMRNQVPDYAMVNAHYVSVKQGRVEVETRAKDAAFDMIKHRMDGKNVVSLLFNAAGDRTVMTSDRASYFMDERRLHVEDHVQALSQDGFLMRGPEATYELNKRLLTAPKPVEGETFLKDMQVWGDRAEAPLDENKLYLYGNARALYDQPGQKHGVTRVRGDSAVVDRKIDKATFHDHVKAEQEDFVGTGETGELYYNSQEKVLRYMSLLKDVKIVQEGGRYTRSQVAEFFAPTDTIVLTGFPAVYDGDDAVNGDKITVYRNTGVVEVTAANGIGAQEKREQKTPGPRNGKPEPMSKEDEELIP